MLITCWARSLIVGRQPDNLRNVDRQPAFHNWVECVSTYNFGAGPFTPAAVATDGAFTPAAELAFGGGVPEAEEEAAKPQEYHAPWQWKERACVLWQG